MITTFKTKWLIFLAAIVGMHAFMLTKLIFFPYPEFFIYPYLTNSGLLPYKEIMDQHFPGLMFFPVNFATLGMQEWQDARVWAIGIVVVIHILLFLIGRRIFNSEKLALLGNLIFIIWQPFFEGWVLWIDSFLPLFLLPAFYFSYLAVKKGRKKDLLLAGLFFGIALLFKQVILPLAILVAAILYIKRRKLSEVIWFGIGITPLPLLMFAYFWKIGVFQDFWYWTVVYNLTTFADYGMKAPFFSGIVRVVAVFGMVLFSWFHRKHGLAFFITLFTVGSLAAAYSRFDFVHFQPALPFVALGTVLALDWLWKKRSVRFIIAIYIAGTIFFLSVFYRGHIGEGVIFFDAETQMVAEKIKQETYPGEHIFIYGPPAHLYQMTETLPSGYIYIQQFSWFLIVSEDLILNSLKRDSPHLVVADRTMSVDEQYLVDFSPKINSYLLENYATWDKIGETEFLKRKDLIYEDKRSLSP